MLYQDRRNHKDFYVKIKITAHSTTKPIFKGWDITGLIKQETMSSRGVKHQHVKYAGREKMSKTKINFKQYKILQINILYGQNYSTVKIITGNKRCRPISVMNIDEKLPNIILKTKIGNVSKRSHTMIKWGLFHT